MKRSRSLLAACSLVLLGACTAVDPRGGLDWDSDAPDATWLTRAQDESKSTTNPQDPKQQEEPKKVEEPKKEKGRSLIVGVLLYLPNRLFDVFDIARVRVRFGPGLSAGIRATRPLSLALGAHAALFIGLHGPRGEASIPWPIGLEDFAGAEISVINGTRAGNVYYGIAEIGAGFQLLLLGVEAGVEPWEVVDFLVGIVTLDPVKDDF